MIIGISGVAGSGKDTLADMLVKHGCVKVALADPIKRMVRDAFSFSYKQLWGPSAERNALDTRYPRKHTWGPDPKDGRYTCVCCGTTCVRGETPIEPDCYLTPRYALQTLGTEWGRNAYSNVWVDYLIRAAQDIYLGGSYSPVHGFESALEPRSEGRSVVVPDVRFKNEIDALRAAGAYLIRIARPGAGLGGSHSSETEQAKIPNGAFDMVVDNTGTLEDLKIHAAQIFEAMELLANEIPPPTHAR